MRSALKQVYDEPPDLLADVRQALSTRPILVDHPERLAVLLGAGEQDITHVLEALTVEGEVLF